MRGARQCVNRDRVVVIEPKLDSSVELPACNIELGQLYLSDGFVQGLFETRLTASAKRERVAT